MTQELSGHIRKEVVTNVVINLLINAGLAWLILGNKGPLAWWGQHGFAQDMIVTAILLTGIVSTIMILVHRKKVAKGELPALHLDPSKWLHRFVAKLPSSVLASVLIFVVISLLLFIPDMFLAFYLLGIEQMTAWHYVILKGLWAGLLSAVMVGPMIMFGLRQEA